MAQDAAIDDRGVSLPVVVGWIVSATTWLALIHLLVGLLIGFAVFLVMGVVIAVGVSMLAVFGLGIVILGLALWLGNQVARAERARFALFLGERINAPPPQAIQERGLRGLWRSVTRVQLWKNFAYALIRLPLSVMETVPLLLVWSLGLALTTLPFYNGFLPGGSAHLDSSRLSSIWAVALATVIGLGLMFIAPIITRALAIGDATVARFLLGSPIQAELTARIGELETSRARVIDAAEAERMRIERDLHDGAQQRLVALAMELGRAKVKFETDPQAAAAIVSQAHEQAKEALAELRNLVRGVHPPVLSDRGLDAALSGLAALCPVPVRVTVNLPVRPPASVEAIAYFVVAEALTNIAKHARASRAEVAVDYVEGPKARGVRGVVPPQANTEGPKARGVRGVVPPQANTEGPKARGVVPPQASTVTTLSLVIRDDGVGGADPSGQGLSGLAARVAGIDGRLNVTSPPGGPTSIEVLLPCGS